MNVLIAFALVFVLISEGRCHYECEENWHLFLQKCFWFNSEAVERAIAEQNCRQQNATMASVHSDFENEYIGHFLKSFKQAQCSHFWLGGKRKQPNSYEIIWDDGSDNNFAGLWEYDYSSQPDHNYLLMLRGNRKWMFYTDAAVCQICEKNATFMNVMAPHSDNTSSLEANIFALQTQLNNSYKILLKDTKMMRATFESFEDNYLHRTMKNDERVELLSQKLANLSNEITLMQEMMKPKKPKSCDENWSLFGEKCFYINTSRVNYDVNAATCQQLNAEMISVHSKEENDFVSSMLVSRRRYWIGGRRNPFNESEFLWNDKSVWNYSFWNTGEPVDAMDEDCIVMFSGRWSISHCDTKHSQLCQKPVNMNVLNSTTKIEASKNFVIQNEPTVHFEKPDILHIYIVALVILLLFVGVTLNLISLRSLNQKYTKLLFFRSVRDIESDTL